MWTTLVTPPSATYFMAASNARSIISAEGAGIDSVHQALGVVFQYPRRLARRVAHDGAALHLARALAHLRRGQRQ
jgi:hypothetical protein